MAASCWKWSDPPDVGHLIADVVIGDWRRPWNRKAGDKPYKPAEHPYTKWAETEEGEWGHDLVWRTDRWMAQPKESRDRPVKASAEMLTLVRNAYRVLLTRGLRGMRLLVLDDETRLHVAETLAGLQG